MIIDVENHYALPDPSEPDDFESGKITERFWGDDGKIGIRKSQKGADIDLFNQFLDEAGIDMAALTHHSVNLDDPAAWHDRAAELMAEYPDRYVCFATVDPLGGEDAMNELRRAVNDLGLKGVHIYTKNSGHFLDDDEMWPFYETVSELDVPINVHIEARPSGFEALEAPYALYYVAAREFDMAASVMRLIFGGVLEDFPELDFIMNHFGGGISSILDRFDVYWEYAQEDAWEGGFFRDDPNISGDYKDYFDKLYFNMGGREAGIASVKSALTNISPDRLMFATDWPLNYDYDPEGAQEYIQEIRNLDLPEQDIENMLGGNAARVMDIDVE